MLVSGKEFTPRTQVTVRSLVALDRISRDTGVNVMEEGLGTGDFMSAFGDPAFLAGLIELVYEGPAGEIDPLDFPLVDLVKDVKRFFGELGKLSSALPSGSSKGNG